MTNQELLSLLGFTVPDMEDVDTRFLPAVDASAPFEAAVLEAQNGLAPLALQSLFGDVVPGSRSDGSGDLLCPAVDVSTGRVSVVEWHHDEPFVWSPLAPDFDTLEVMGDLLGELDDLDVDVRVLERNVGRAGVREDRLALIDAAGLTEVLSRWPAVGVPKSYDFAEWRGLLTVSSPVDQELMAPAVRAVSRLHRAGWVATILAGEWAEAPPDADIGRSLEAVVAADALPPGDVYYALFAAWLTGRDVMVRSVCERAAASSAGMVRSAIALAQRLLAGHTLVGCVDLAEAREALVARTVVPPGQLTQAEIDAAKPLIRSFIVPGLTEWTDAALAWTGLEVFETKIRGQLPASIAGLRVLRRFTSEAVLPPEIAQLSELQELDCVSLPAAAASLTKLRSLRFRLWTGDMADMPYDTIAKLTSLEELSVSAPGDVVIPDSWRALTRLRTFHVEGRTVDLGTGLASLSALESLSVRAAVAPLCDGWGGATSLREVRIAGTLPENLAVLASAPSLRVLALDLYAVCAAPDLSAFSGLDVLRFWATTEDPAAAGAAVASVADVRRLEFRGSGKGPGPHIMPDTLVGLGAKELVLDVTLGSDWPSVGKVLRGAKALERLTLTSIVAGEAPVDDGAWPAIESLTMNQLATNLFANVGKLPALRELVLGTGPAMYTFASQPVPTGAFLDGVDTCTRLEVVRLAGRQPRPVDVERIGALPAVRELDLSQCGIEALPEGFASAAPLMHLDLRNNPIAELPPALGKPTLRVLRLAGTNVTSLDALSVPTQLEHLDIACGQLSRVPAWLGELAALRRLELAGPALDLEHALSVVAVMPALRELVIRDVTRDGLPLSLFALEELELLHLINSDYQTPWMQLRARLPKVRLILS